MLSWWPDLCPKNNQDNVNKTLLLDGLFISAFTLSEEEPVYDTERTLLLDHLFLNTLDLGLHTQIVSSTNQDCIVSDALIALQMNGTPLMRSALSDWWHKDGIVFYTDKCYVPDDIGLWQEIVKWYHNLLPMGHPGHLKTLELLRRDYWWPGMHTFKLCWQMCCLSTSKDKPAPDRPASNAYQRLHNRMTLCPDFLWFHHRLASLGHLLGIELAMSTAYHPQIDGATEWSN